MGNVEGNGKGINFLGDPRQELLNKLTWVYGTSYGTIPYILAYYARGMVVTLVALYMQDKTKKLKLCSFDLSTLNGRVDIILALSQYGQIVIMLKFFV